MGTPLPVVDTAHLIVPDATPDAFYPLLRHLHVRGWQVKITTDHHIGGRPRAQVSIKRDNWQGMTLPGYAYAYLANSMGEAEVIAALRKLVALDAALRATFHATFPAQQVHHDGTIREDVPLTEKAQLGQLALLEYLCEQRREPPSPTHIRIEHGFIQLRVDGTGLLLDQTEVATLKGILHDARHPQ